ncbi:MAG TPA: metallophosphoesterase, partial [Allosphingosinicella sp.]|nr:metallophosphoesterase [Allosphingosinicella sp.]
MADIRAVEELARLTARAAARPDDLLGDLDELLAFLVESENQTLALIAYLKHRQRPPVAPPGGDIEFGFVLYWLHHPPLAVELYLALHPLLLIAYELLLSRAPPTNLTRGEYEELEAAFHHYGEPGPDGTIYGYKKYQQLDHDWMLAALNYVLNVLDPCAIHPFPDNRVVPIPLCRKDGDTAKDPVLGIVGDWGTGYFPDEGGAPCPAQRVIEQIADPARSPPIDYLIHLGDVYYAGTDWRPVHGEEADNFYALWPDQGQGRNFTLNSNHEMYGAASGYFDVALQRSGLFAAQNGMSYFALTYGPWLVLGLDSGYYSDAYNGREFYMAGAIGAPGLERQIDWVKQFRTHQGPIMVMTHHDTCDLAGET